MDKKIDQNLNVLNEIFEIVSETHSFTNLLLKIKLEEVGTSVTYDCISAMNKLLRQAENLAQIYQEFHQI